MGTFSAFVLFVVVSAISCRGTELTFEIAESSRECFYEEADQGSSVTLEFQVVDGGAYDVDVAVHAPSGKTVYSQERTQYDTVTFTAAENGTFMVCFGNEFSTFSHKLVYMDFEVMDRPDDLEYEPPPTPTAMTQMETSVQEIQDSLKTVVTHQTHHRLMEAMSRKRAEDLNDRVFYWSLAETVAILFVTISQVYIVKQFFAYSNPLHSGIR